MMKRIGRRGRTLGVTEPDEDLLDDETQKRMLEDAGIEVEDMTAGERKSILKAILESNPELRKVYEKNTPAKDLPETNRCEEQINANKLEQATYAPGSLGAHDSPVASVSAIDIESDSSSSKEEAFWPKTKRCKEHENASVNLEKISYDTDSLDAPLSPVASVAAVDIESDSSSSREETEATQAPDLFEPAHEAEKHETSSTTTSEDGRQTMSPDPKVLQQNTHQIPPCQNKTSSFTGNVQQHDKIEIEKCTLSENLKPKLSRSCSEEDAQIVLDSDDEQETQAYDIQQDHLLVPNTERSPSQERILSPGFAIPESQCEDDSGEAILLPQNERQTHETHKKTSINTDEKTTLRDISLKVDKFKMLKYFAPDWMEDAGDYAQVIKLLLANYVRRLARAQRAENPCKWGKPVKAGPHVEGCLKAKCRVRYEDETGDELKSRGGRGLRRRNVPVFNEVLMEDVKSREGEREDDEDFENPHDDYGTTHSKNFRDPRTRLRNKRGITSNEEDDDEQITVDQGKRKCARQNGRRKSAIDLMDEEDARELFNEEDNNDSEEEWIPLPRKEAVQEVIVKESSSGRGKGRGRKPRKGNEKKLTGLPWLSKGKSHTETRGKGKREENLDSDQEQEMIFSTKSKLVQDSYTELFNQPLMVLDKKRTPGKKFSSSDDSGEEYFPSTSDAAKKKGRSTKKNEHVPVLTKGKRQQGEGLNVKKRVKKKSASHVKNLDSSSDSETVISNGEGGDFESFKNIPTDTLKPNDDEDSCFEIEKPTKDSEKPLTSVRSSQEMSSGIPQSQSSNSLLDIHGDLYSTQFGGTGMKEKLSQSKKRNKEENPEHMHASISFSEVLDEQPLKFKLNSEVRTSGSKKEKGKEESVFKTLKLRRNEDMSKSTPKNIKQTDESIKRLFDPHVVTGDKDDSDLEINLNPDIRWSAIKSDSGKRKSISKAVISCDDTSVEDVPRKRRKLNLSDSKDQVKKSRGRELNETSLGMGKLVKKKDKVGDRKCRRQSVDKNKSDNNSETAVIDILESDGESPKQNEQVLMEADEIGTEAKPGSWHQFSPTGTCPICGSTFSLKELERHASSCGEEAVQESDEEGLRKCVYCNVEVSHQDMKYHQADCSQSHSKSNPSRTTRSGRGGPGANMEK